MRQIRRENPRDALPALQLARTLETSRIYLLSRLDAGLVEELEMIPLAGPDELRGWSSEQLVSGLGQRRACDGPRGRRMKKTLTTKSTKDTMYVISRSELCPLNFPALHPQC